MAKNEHTSEEVAGFASEILKMQNPRLITDELWHKIQSVAGSALTQAPDKKHPLTDAYYESQLLNKNPLGRGFSALVGKSLAKEFIKKT
jgi:hypothetical protein